LKAFGAADAFRIGVLIEGFLSPKSIFAFSSRKGTIPFPWSSLSANLENARAECIQLCGSNVAFKCHIVNYIFHREKSHIANTGKQSK